MLSTIIVSGILIVMVFLAIRTLIKSAKNGKCVGCSGCESYGKENGCKSCNASFNKDKDK